ncbi:MAG: hypothetical protein BWY63_01902 [Chloroflexi bacterium ADurb.Bin360]|nr:MAG: hypothetical protein BWY63_01902 [Chloroflexi bacterium ADurb.Bin360]
MIPHFPQLATDFQGVHFKMGARISKKKVIFVVRLRLTTKITQRKGKYPTPQISGEWTIISSTDTQKLDNVARSRRNQFVCKIAAISSAL